MFIFLSYLFMAFLCSFYYYYYLLIILSCVLSSNIAK